MESIIQFTCEHSHIAHLILFSLLMLAGLNVPLSEDLIVITGGYLASCGAPNAVIPWYIWIFFGCWLSAWETYWLGRLLGPKLYTMRWFKRVITPQRIEKLHSYYERFGIFTFLVGRFIPGGVRNALFMSSGLGKMPFQTFILRDGFGCLLSSSTLFMIGYLFAKNTDFIVHFSKTYHVLGLLVILAVIITSIFLILKNRKISSQ